MPVGGQMTVTESLLGFAPILPADSAFKKTEPMRTIKHLTFATLAALAVTLLSPLPASAADEASHEVWMIDQSNSYDSDGNGTLDSGGTLYIYSFDGSELAGNAASQASPQKIDLAVRSPSGSNRRPEHCRFGRTTSRSTFAHARHRLVRGSGHVLIFDAATRTPIFTVDVGAQVHAAEASPDETYILVTNQNGKLLQRINTDYLRNAFALDAAATLDLATGTTPSGALKQDDGVTQLNVRPDTAPIMAMRILPAPWRSSRSGAAAYLS